MLNEKMISVIRSHLSEEELLCQLAEECSELTQAALKMRRATTGVNPTPVTVDEATRSINEEIADILLVLRVLGYPYEAQDVELIQNRKLSRWVQRLIFSTLPGVDEKNTPPPSKRSE